jgi:energy-converting hydrogenase Eha subunit E
MIRVGLARTATLFLALAVAGGLVSLLAGLALGAGAARSLSLGWACTGAFLLLLGFLATSRGPTRAVDGGGWAPISLRGRSLRWASRAEQEESLGISALLVVLGLLLIALGVAVDPRHRLF